MDDISPAERFMRSKARIPRLEQAITKEKDKDMPDHQRIESLNAELRRRQKEVDAFLEGVKT